MALVKVVADTSQADAFGHTLQRLEVELNTSRHLQSVTRAAFEVLSKEFKEDTLAMAQVMPELFHHVFEWENIGIPGAELFTPVMRGRGGDRLITWEWRASKTTVPTEVDALGRQKFPSWFPVEKLNRIHVFVWKAPIMEYGLETSVSPKLSPLLVLPNPQRRLVLDVHPDAPRDVVFTPYSYSIDHSKQMTQGAFTKWFNDWMLGGRAQTVLGESFEDPRDAAFKRSFRSRIKGLMAANKQFRIGVDPAAASTGKTIARLIAGDLERNYIAMAARRKR